MNHRSIIIKSRPISVSDTSAPIRKGEIPFQNHSISVLMDNNSLTTTRDPHNRVTVKFDP